MKKFIPLCLALICIVLFLGIIFKNELIFYGYFEIFICIAILSWALSQHDKIVYGFALVTLALTLCFIYYALNVSFLVKSLSIFSSGLILLILTWVLHKFQSKEGVNT